MRTKRLIALSAAGAAAALLAACLPDSLATGRLTLSLTDAPVDNATEVVVVFDGVELKPADGTIFRFNFDSPRAIDVLDLQQGRTEALLDDEVLSAGDYDWLRLLVTAEAGRFDSYIRLASGAQHPLSIPSGAETGLKLVRGFTVPINGTADYTVDFDLRRSIVQTGSGEYRLKPALRLIDDTEVGTIAGTASGTVLGSCGSEDADVYVYEGNVDGGNLDDTGSGNGPLTTAPVVYDDDAAEYRYTAAFLTAGTYTLALTCEADQDDPEEDDDIGFHADRTTFVTVGETSIVRFE